MDLPNKRYEIIYADPAWQYDFSIANKDTAISGCAEQHYSTMSVEEIMALPIKALTADDCVLFMWATYPQLKEAFKVIEAWGFKYKTVAFTWVKRADNGKYAWGCGFWTRSNAEICLLATKGKPKRLRSDVHQVIESRRGKHSAKPAAAYTRIEQLMGDLPRLELFARHRRAGWDVWGDQVPPHTQELLREAWEKP